MPLSCAILLAACSDAGLAELECAEWPHWTGNAASTQQDVAIWAETKVKPAFDDCKLVNGALNKQIHDIANQ